MIDKDLSEDLLRDLMRSSWLIERARAEIYSRWQDSEPRWSASRERLLERASLIEADLARRGRQPDEANLEGHSLWMLRIVGEDPTEVPLADLFVQRLGDWVDAHAGPFLADDQQRLLELGELDRAVVSFPTNLPPAPPYEPLVTPELEPPGETLFRFGILGDLHFGSGQGERTARAAIADLNASGAELVIQLGDITDHGNRSEFESAAAALKELEMPFATMMGNHDVMSIEEERLSGREYYPASFGREPDGMILEHKGFRFAVLDSVEIAAAPFSAFDLVTGTFTEGSSGAVVRGSLTATQHELLAEVAERDSGPTFVFLHHPPQPFLGFPPILFGLREADSGRLHATVDSGNVWGVFAGHTHRNARTLDFDGVPAHEVGIPRDFPFGYALVDVSRTGYSYRFVQLSDEELLRSGYDRSGTIHRRYGAGRPEERAFVWNRALR